MNFIVVAIEILLVFFQFFLFSRQFDFFARQYSQLSCGISVLDIFLLSFPGQIQQFERVSDQVRLDPFIERRLSGKGRRMVHFNQVGLQVFIKHDIEAQDFERHHIFQVFALSCRIVLDQFWLHCNDRLDYDRFDVFPKFVSVDIHISHFLPELGQ